MIIKNLEALIDIGDLLQEAFEVSDGYLLHRAGLHVHPVVRERGELGTLLERSVVIVIDAAVGGPQVCRYADAVLIVPADRVSGSGYPGDHVRCAAAVIVEALADGVFLGLPGPVVELLDLRNHVGQGVGGGLVVRVSMVLVGVQLASLVVHNVGIVFQHSLGILELAVKVSPREGLHVSSC